MIEEKITADISVRCKKILSPFKPYCYIRFDCEEKNKAFVTLTLDVIDASAPYEEDNVVMMIDDKELLALFIDLCKAKRHDFMVDELGSTVTIKVHNDGKIKVFMSVTVLDTVHTEHILEPSQGQWTQIEH